MDEPTIEVAVRMPIDCPISCPDWAFLHQDDCVLTRHLQAWDVVDAAVLRALGSPFVRPARPIERTICSPDCIGDWVLVERHAKYGIPMTYFEEVA
jgi:hypothetical protein